VRRLVLIALVAACGKVGGEASTADDPTIASVEPDHGPVLGGIPITVTGTGLDAADPVVVVGDLLATDVVAASSTQLTFTLPAGLEGERVDITVANQNGFATAPAAFTYNLQPVVLAISPALGRGMGGTTVTITGRGFQSAEAGVPTIMIGGGMATDVQIVDDKTITAVTGAVPAGTPAFRPVDVMVTNANGSSTLPESFTITARGLLALQRSNRVFYVNTADGSSVQLPPLAHHIIACAPGPGGVMYGVGRNESDGEVELFTFDPTVGSVEVIGKLLDSGNVNHGAGSLAFVNGTLYGLNVSRIGTAGRLLQINTSTGVVALLGSATPLAIGKPAVIAPKDAASLYVVENTSAPVHTLTTAGALTPGTTPMTGGRPNQRLHGMAVAAGTLYVLERSSPGTIYILNPVTATLTQFAALNTSTGGLCETPSSF
jgi:hypothetical protein